MKFPIFHLVPIAFCLWAPLSMAWLCCLYSPHEVFMPLIVFMAFCYTDSSISVFIPYWGAENWTQHSRCLTRNEYERDLLPQPAAISLANLA